MLSFFKKREQVVDDVIPVSNSQDVLEFVLANPIPTAHPENAAQPEDASIGSEIKDFIKGDPSLRRQIWACPADKQDEIRKAYIQRGAYQPKKEVYPPSGEEGHKRRFQYHWFGSFTWLEYSPLKDAAFCFPCFLFSKKPKGKCGSNAFTVKGFQKWKRVNNGKEYLFCMS